MALLLDFLMVPFLVLFAVVTGIEDARCATIRNKWIVSAIVYTAATFLCQVLVFRFRGTAFEISYFISFGINAALAGLLGIVAWLSNLWTAADAKLFFAYSIAVPLHWYRRALVPVFPSFSILLNAVLPLAGFYTFVTLVRLVRGPKAQGLRSALLEGMKPRKHAELLLFLFGFSWLVGWLLGSVLQEPGFFMLIAAMLILYWLARRFISRLLIPFSAVACAARLIFDLQTVLSPGFLAGFVQMYLLIALVFVLLLNLSSLAFSESVAISKLKPGMMLAEDVRAAVGSAAVIHEIGHRRFLFAERSEGLTSEEIALLKKLKKEKKFALKEMRVAQSVPFAPFLAMGALLAALIGGNVLLLI